MKRGKWGAEGRMGSWLTAALHSIFALIVTANLAGCEGGDSGGPQSPGANPSVQEPSDDAVKDLVEKRLRSNSATLLMEASVRERAGSRDLHGKTVYPITVAYRYMEAGMKYGGFQFGAPHYKDKEITVTAEFLVGKNQWDEWHIADSRTLERQEQTLERPESEAFETHYRTPPQSAVPEREGPTTQHGEANTAEGYIVGKWLPSNTHSRREIIGFEFLPNHVMRMVEVEGNRAKKKHDGTWTISAVSEDGRPSSVTYGPSDPKVSFTMIVDQQGGELRLQIRNDRNSTDPIYRLTFVRVEDWNAHLPQDDEARRERIVAIVDESLRMISMGLTPHDEDPEVLSRIEALNEEMDALLYELGFLGTEYDKEKFIWEIVKKYKPELLSALTIGVPDDYERFVPATLKSICNAQEIFSFSDLDRNNLPDYWVADVSGLYRIKVGNRLIAVFNDIESALADAAPVVPLDKEGEFKGLTLAALRKGKPRMGYHFRMLAEYENADGKWLKYDADGDGRGSRYGVCAIPHIYGATGTMTFMISEAGAVFMKDTHGEPPEGFPYDPDKAGWKRLE